jgi:hypothetical protein
MVNHRRLAGDGGGAIMTNLRPINLSRRNIVASVAVLPALAVPAAAMTEHPSDAQLEALSAQIVELWHMSGFRTPMQVARTTTTKQ